MRKYMSADVPQCYAELARIHFGLLILLSIFAYIKVGNQEMAV